MCNCILIAKTKTEAEKTMKKLVSSGKILSYEPALILRDTDDGISAIVPANRMFMHTEYIDCIVLEGEFMPMNFRKFRLAFADAMVNNLK